jgi:hypothetical protein
MAIPTGQILRNGISTLWLLEKECSPDVTVAVKVLLFFYIGGGSPFATKSRTHAGIFPHRAVDPS